MIKKSTVIWLGVVALTPLIIFSIYFFSYDVSKSPDDWSDFATYLSGTTGILASIIAGYFLFITLKSQNKQNTESTFFNYLNTFSVKNEDMAKRLIETNQNLYETVHKNQKVKPGSMEERNKKAEYLDYLKKDFIEEYSINSPTPRLRREYVKYFKGIASFSYIIKDSDLEKKDSERLRLLFLSMLSEGEIKMICYYYYLFFDIIKSKDENFTTVNFVRDSKLFDDPLNFSDDFSHNFDPRGHDYDDVLADIKKIYKARRIKQKTEHGK